MDLIRPGRGRGSCCILRLTFWWRCSKDNICNSRFFEQKSRSLQYIFTFFLLFDGPWWSSSDFQKAFDRSKLTTLCLSWDPIWKEFTLWRNEGKPHSSFSTHQFNGRFSEIFVCAVRLVNLKNRRASMFFRYHWNTIMLNYQRYRVIGARILCASSTRILFPFTIRFVWHVFKSYNITYEI